MLTREQREEIYKKHSYELIEYKTLTDYDGETYSQAGSSSSGVHELIKDVEAAVIEMITENQSNDKDSFKGQIIKYRLSKFRWEADRDIVHYQVQDVLDKMKSAAYPIDLFPFFFKNDIFDIEFSRDGKTITVHYMYGVKRQTGKVSIPMSVMLSDNVEKAAYDYGLLLKEEKVRELLAQNKLEREKLEQQLK